MKIFHPLQKSFLLLGCFYKTLFSFHVCFSHYIFHLSFAEVTKPYKHNDAYLNLKSVLSHNTKSNKFKENIINNIFQGPLNNYY